MQRITSLCLLLLASGAMAQSLPKINSVQPEYVQRGGTVDVILRGDNLPSATGLILSGDPGVTAVLSKEVRGASDLEASRGGIRTATQVMDPNSVVARLTIASDAPLGAREIRVAAAHGVSAPRRIVIGDLPEIVEPTGTEKPETAPALPLPGVVSGVITALSETDHYRFTAVKGQTFAFEVHSSRLGSPLDPDLTVIDEAGKEMVRKQSIGSDTRLIFTAPMDGRYVLQLRDFRFQGGGGHRYRLTSSASGFVTSVYPLGGQAGTSVELALSGINLGSVKKLKLQLDPTAPLGIQDIRVQTGSGFSNPFRFEVGSAPETLEIAPNQSREQATVGTAPGAFNGRISQPKERDFFKFKAAVDQRLVIEASASKFGSGLDVLLSLLDAAGNVLVRNDDAAGVDARIDFDVKKDQEYFLVIQDLLDRGDEGFVYRVVCSVPQPNYTLKILPDLPRVSRGSHVVVRCELNRMGGFAETVRVNLENLPPGIIGETLVFSPSSLPNATLTLSASKEAQLGNFPIRAVGVSTLAGQPVQRVAEVIDGPKPPGVPDTTVRVAVLTVLDAPAFAIEQVAGSIQVEQESSGNLEVFVHRRAGFHDDIRLTMEGFAYGRDPITRNFEAPVVTLKSNQTHATIPMKAVFNSEIGTRALWVKAESGTYAPQYSQKFPATIVQLPFVLACAPSKDTQLPFDSIRTTVQTKISLAALPEGRASAASESSFAVSVDRRAGFAGEVVLSLEGLPEGVTATLANIPAAEKVAMIKLNATSKAPAGKEFPVTIVGTSTFNDRIFRQKTKPITVIITAASETTESPKPAASAETVLVK